MLALTKLLSCCLFHDSCRAVLLQQQQQQTAVGLPERVMISAGRSRQRDHISGLLRDSTQALLTSWTSPFAFVTTAVNSPSAGSVSNGSNNGNGNGSNNSKLEAAGTKVTDWLLSEGMQKVLSGFMRPAPGSITSSIAADLVTEGKLDKRCQDAFAAVKEFENNHCLSVQSMGAAYTAARPGLVTALLGLQSKLGLRDDVVRDAVLLLDRAMSASFKVWMYNRAGQARVLGSLCTCICCTCCAMLNCMGVHKHPVLAMFLAMPCTRSCTVATLATRHG
jgi:hypothetical protein